MRNPDPNDKRPEVTRQMFLPAPNAEIIQLTRQAQTPFHLYDAQGIRTRAEELTDAFAWTHEKGSKFRNYFAVKATPNPSILGECFGMGMGMDCSSLGELLLCEKLGIIGESIMFTSNNTSHEEYRTAFRLGALINLDDYMQMDNLYKALGSRFPETISFRFNPGPERTGNVLIGDPVEAKYGLTRSQLLPAFLKAKKLGAARFGLHTMVVSNSLSVEELVETTKMMFQLSVDLAKEGVFLEFLNMGGGIGIAYRPEEYPVDLAEVGNRVKESWIEVFNEEQSSLFPDSKLPEIKYECGRLITCDNGWIISRVMNLKHTYKRYVGLDATMADLMRPGMYGAYHHLTVIPDPNCPRDNLADIRNLNDGDYADVDMPRKFEHPMVCDVTGSLCENNDKFAIDRKLNEEAEIGDIVVIHCTGAHGHSMGFNYNAKLRHGEILRIGPNNYRHIRRAETYDDHFATIVWPQEEKKSTFTLMKSLDDVKSCIL